MSKEVPDEKGESLRKLVDTILVEGAENYSRLARLLNVPEETIRYRITNQFPRRGIALHIALNYEKIGLARKIVTITFSRHYGRRATNILEEMSKQLYITYYGKTMGTHTYTLMLAVPMKIWIVYADLLQYLVEKNILRSFEVEDISSYLHIPLRTRLYDFRKGQWEFQWPQVTDLDATPPDLHTVDFETSVREPDHVDLAILSELQANATLSVSKIASNIRVSEDVAYYHYLEHVKKRRLISQYVVGWV